MGADDAILISDKALAGSDALVTSKVLAAAIKKIGNYSLIITGEESEDGSTGQVPQALPSGLEYPW